MEIIRANAALAEMKGIQDALTQRVVTLAGDLAVAQAELANLRTKVQDKGSTTGPEMPKQPRKEKR